MKQAVRGKERFLPNSFHEIVFLMNFRQFKMKFVKDLQEWDDRVDGVTVFLMELTEEEFSDMSDLPYTDGFVVRKSVKLTAENRRRVLNGFGAHRYATESEIPNMSKLFSGRVTEDELVTYSEYVEHMGHRLELQTDRKRDVIALNLLDSVRQLHSIGVVHRDIAPNNMQFNHDRFILVDFSDSARNTREFNDTYPDIIGHYQTESFMEDEKSVIEEYKGNYFELYKKFDIISVWRSMQEFFSSPLIDKANKDIDAGIYD